MNWWTEQHWNKMTRYAWNCYHTIRNLKRNGKINEADLDDINLLKYYCGFPQDQVVPFDILLEATKKALHEYQSNNEGIVSNTNVRISKENKKDVDKKSKKQYYKKLFDLDDSLFEV